MLSRFASGHRTNRILLDAANFEPIRSGPTEAETRDRGARAAGERETARDGRACTGSAERDSTKRGGEKVVSSRKIEKIVKKLLWCFFHALSVNGCRRRSRRVHTGAPVARRYTVDGGGRDNASAGLLGGGGRELYGGGGAKGGPARRWPMARTPVPRPRLPPPPRRRIARAQVCVRCTNGTR